jgi:hypothetical protein
MWRLLNKHVNGPFEKVSLAQIDELPLPVPPEACDHALGEYNSEGLIVCADCGQEMEGLP